MIRGLCSIYDAHHCGCGLPQHYSATWAVLATCVWMLPLSGSTQAAKPMQLTRTFQIRSEDYSALPSLASGHALGRPRYGSPQTAAQSRSDDLPGPASAGLDAEFGRTPDGRVVEVITLTSGALEARVITYGARLISVRARTPGNNNIRLRHCAMNPIWRSAPLVPLKQRVVRELAARLVYTNEGEHTC